MVAENLPIAIACDITVKGNETASSLPNAFTFPTDDLLKINEIMLRCSLSINRKEKIEREKRKKKKGKPNQSITQSSRKTQRLHCNPSGRGKVLSM